MGEKCALLRKILSGTEQSEDRSSIEDWDGFRLDPQAWARSLIGVSEQAIQLWEPTTPADGTDPPGTFLLSLEWSSPPVTRRARLECASLVNSWISAARNYQARCQRRAARDSGKSRKAALRRLDFKTWARMLRPLPVGLQVLPRVGSGWSGTLAPTHQCAGRVGGGGAGMERLFHTPSIPWQHPAFLSWSDKLGNQRGGLNFEHLANMLHMDGEETVPPAILETGPWCIMRWQPRSVQFLSVNSVSFPGWVLSWMGASIGWQARRPGPCSGPVLQVHCFGRVPANEWSMDRFRHMADVNVMLYAIALRPHSFSDHSALLRLEPDQREHWNHKMRWSRTGRSGFKLAFLPLLPGWCQALFWELTDIQRETALIAPSNKKAIQFNLPKSSGGFRPLSMMEEAFKLIEGPVTQRIATSRSQLELGTVYSKTNLAYEKKQAATSEVLYTDCLVCEIAARTGSPFARVPSDYEKYFNSIMYERSRCHANGSWYTRHGAAILHRSLSRDHCSHRHSLGAHA